MPVAEPIDATEALLVYQVPPPTASLRVIAEPAAAVAAPDMGAATGLTRKVTVAIAVPTW